MKKYYRLLVIFLVLSCWIPHVSSAQNVEFLDANLAKRVREALNLPAGADIPKAQLETLTHLDDSRLLNLGPEDKIHDLTGLEHATHLTKLDLTKNNITDLSPLAELTQLTEFLLADNNVSNISPLAGLTRLRSLYLRGNPIIDMSPLDAYLRKHTDSGLGIEVDGIWSVSFSPDGTLLATGSFDGTVKLWDVVSQKNTATLPTGSVTSVAFSPDGILLVTGGGESLSGRVKLWDVATKENIGTADVTLTIYAVNGQVVRKLSLGHQEAGVYQSRSRAAYWDGKMRSGNLWRVGSIFIRSRQGILLPRGRCS